MILPSFVLPASIPAAWMLNYYCENMQMLRPICSIVIGCVKRGIFCQNIWKKVWQKHITLLFCSLYYYAIPEQKIVIVNSAEWHFNAFQVFRSQVVSFIFTLIQNRFHKANT